MIKLFFYLFFIVNIYSASDFEIPKESYLTFDDFLTSQSSSKTPVLNAPDDWIKLQYAPPLIAKFQVNSDTTLSISIFSGSIGDELSNINRWRGQLRLSPLESLDNSLQYLKSNNHNIRFIEMNNTQQYFLIYWLIVENRHIFNKIVSKAPISTAFFNDFIEGQSWEKL